MGEPFSLEQGMYWVMPFSTERTRRFKYSVDANGPVGVYIVDEEGLTDFESGDRDFEVYEGAGGRKAHRLNVRLAPGEYFLIISNESNRVLAVSHGVD